MPLLVTPGPPDQDGNKEKSVGQHSRLRKATHNLFRLSKMLSRFIYQFSFNGNILKFHRILYHASVVRQFQVLFVSSSW